MVYGIVKHHGGFVNLKAIPGKAQPSRFLSRPCCGSRNHPALMRNQPLWKGTKLFSW